MIFFRIKAADGFKLVVGAALVLAKKEHIRTDLGRGGEFAYHAEGGWRGACCVAAQSHNVRTDAVGELLLREAAVLTPFGES